MGTDVGNQRVNQTHLCANSTIHVDKIHMSELFLYLLDLRVAVSSTD